MARGLGGARRRAARLAELDAGHGDAEHRAESAKADLTNTANPPQPQLIPGGLDLTGCDVLLEARAAALEVEARTLMRLIHRKAIRDAAEFEAIIAAFAEAARVYPPYEVVAAMMVADYPRLKVNARHGKDTRARARDNVAAEVRARVAEILANPAAAPAVTGEVREEIIGLADRLASASEALITTDGLATIGVLADIYEGLAKSRKA